MRRRTFVASLGSTAVAWPLVAWAQRRVPRIGYLGTDRMYLEIFEAGLRDVGYVVGNTIEIESRFGVGEEQMAELARELVDLKIDVIVTNGPGVYGAHRVTKTVPIVAASAADLVMFGFADSLAHPGGNVTGQTFFYAETQSFLLNCAAN
jgi:putative ABC transport system substrate-binding protein